MQALRRVPVVIQFNLLLLLIVGLLTIGTLVTFGNGFNSFGIETSQQRLEDEINAMQTRLADEEAALVTNVSAVAGLPIWENVILSNRPPITSNTDPTILRYVGTSSVVELEGVSFGNLQLLDTRDNILFTNYDHEYVFLEDQPRARDFLYQVALNGTSAAGVEVLGEFEDDDPSGEIEEALHLLVAAPIIDNDGDVIGVLIGFQELDNDFLAAFNFDRQEINLALYQRGERLAQYRPAAGTNADLNFNSDNLARAEAGEVIIEDNFVENQGSTDPHLNGYFPIRFGGRLIGAMVVQINRAELESFQADLRDDTLLILSLLGVGGVALFILGTQLLILGPLRGLTEGAAAIGSGNLEHRIKTRNMPGREFEQLGETFNHMAGSLQDRRQQLEELNESLDERVKERTAELEKARQEAVEANRLKDEFLATMSHELRTPLNAIIGFLGLMKMTGNLDERQADMITRSRGNAERLLSLINDILDISRIESGRLKLYEVPINLQLFAEQSRNAVAAQCAEKGIDLHIQVDDKLPESVLLDEDGITKIITNLMSNAVKFTDKGSVSLKIESGEPKRLVFRIIDSGIGIPAHMHEIIFDRFRQVDSTSTREYGGTGLGLTIVQELTRAMGGTIEVESEVGAGSTFIVDLPLKTEPEAIAEA